ncbi:hypothetical protein JJD26997_1633 [Campylobacter jejuni subsp. doylei 269.97]|uniref:Uncharacterized protein n=1 Tax=Campylobacter jejuni subsp. doylei (strain ATCC BAA-1458 / RM4099 / 269.97) TaxID=360109 RepID=A7H542_CAMJD|nr:hypothetical protein JJD26997_1633 [Campylobacter jejuni subsp. doylei 269.97]
MHLFSNKASSSASTSLVCFLISPLGSKATCPAVLNIYQIKTLYHAYFP